MSFHPMYKPFGERSILIEWPERIDPKILNDIIQFKDLIQKNNIKVIVDLKSAYNSLLIVYDSICRNFENDVIFLKKLYKTLKSEHDIMSKRWKIPVCYDAVFGIDLKAISKEKNLSISEIIDIHSKAFYTVYFIGFLPGFLYLGGLDEAIFMPRKRTPRLKVEKGAVAIGENQTGIYPTVSPGGWNIIGNSPVSFFNINKEVPCFANPGDQITFQSISIKEYLKIKAQIENNDYQIESEVIYD
jgi:inhibitor of KinA